MLSWNQILEEEFSQDYFKTIKSTLMEENKTTDIFPPQSEIFNAFNYCPYGKIKAIILGMDAYHSPKQAHGLAFSVKPPQPKPPSLQNIFKELKSDLNIDPPNHGSLISWAKQGILLLNSALTVRKNEPGSHIKLWEPFTKNILKRLNNYYSPLVLICWGNFARSKKYLMANGKHHIICGNHPSPLSANRGGFFGGKYFSKTNEFLLKNNIEPINWQIESHK